MEPMNELKVGNDVHLRSIVKSVNADEPLWYAQVRAVDTALTLNMLHCIKDYKKCIHISYQSLDLVQKKKTKVTMDQPYMLLTIYCQYHVCWCHGHQQTWYWPNKPEYSVYCIRRVDTLKPRQNGLHFADDIFRLILLYEICVKFVPKCPVNSMRPSDAYMCQ